MNEQKMTAPKIKNKKRLKEPIAAITAYDYPTALLADSAGVDIILVGDSVGNTVLGYENTLPVTMEEMLHHLRAVKRGVKNALLVGDMPFLSYQTSVEDAIRNAGLMMKAGAEAVKLEGGAAFADTIKRLVECGIPVMGHVGMTPQSVNNFGGYRVQGRGTQANMVIADSGRVQESGAFAVVLELIPAVLSEKLTSQLTIPTIGIGAGPACDGEIQVLHDILGLLPGAPHKHTKQYINGFEQLSSALKQYTNAVRNREFPTEENSS